jgi:hypothetical protein
MTSAQLLQDMSKLNQDLIETDVLVSSEGVQASSKGARVAFPGKRPDLIAGYWIWKVDSLEESGCATRAISSMRSQAYK